MRRKTTSQDHRWREYDIKKDIKPERLAAIGALNVAWNDIEGAIDVCTCLAMEAPYPLWLDLTSRINGLDGKFAIIKKSAREHIRFPEKVATAICATIEAIAEHKTFRDSVIHARIIDPDEDVAPANASKGTQYEVIVSQKALDSLFDRLSCLQNEIDDVLHLFHFRCVVLRASRTGQSGVAGDPDAARALRSIPFYFAQLQEHQKHRQSLAPLPSFPLKPPVPPASGGDPPNPEID